MQLLLVRKKCDWLDLRPANIKVPEFVIFIIEAFLICGVTEFQVFSYVSVSQLSLFNNIDEMCIKNLVIIFKHVKNPSSMFSDEPLSRSTGFSFIQRQRHIRKQQFGTSPECMPRKIRQKTEAGGKVSVPSSNNVIGGIITEYVLSG